jgi:hypothetical protein
VIDAEGRGGAPNRGARRCDIFIVYQYESSAPAAQAPPRRRRPQSHRIDRAFHD